MKKILPILLLSVLVLSGCLNNFPEEELIKEINSGTYRVSGIQVELTYDFPWPSWGGEEVILSRDTTEIEFMVEIEYPKGVLARGKADTVHFRGLEGSDAGEHTIAFTYCTPPFCYTVARLIGDELTFDLTTSSGFYVGRGTLGAEKLTLETHYEYRPTGVDYFLEGEKIDEE
jgi:hypothetical protein